MRRIFFSMMLTGVLFSQVSSAAPTKEVPAPAPAAAPQSTEDTLKAMRSDLQGQRADIMAKNITLTAEQASKFWPAYSKFQEDQNLILDEQLNAAKKFVDGYETLDDAKALAHVNGFLDRDLKMNNLYRKWLVEFQKILPAKTAARVIQIDRRLGTVAQISIASKIPLVH